MRKNEAELIKSVLKGNPGDFTPLVEKYQSVVYGLAFSLTGDFSMAQDMPAFSPGYIYLVIVPARLWHRQGIFSPCPLHPR